MGEWAAPFSLLGNYAKMRDKSEKVLFFHPFTHYPSHQPLAQQIVQVNEAGKSAVLRHDQLRDVAALHAG